LLAERLLDADQPDEARRVLEGALREHQYAPGNIRWRNCAGPRRRGGC
jgi:hypothetical protein